VGARRPTSHSGIPTVVTRSCLSSNGRSHSPLSQHKLSLPGLFFTIHRVWVEDGWNLTQEIKNSSKIHIKLLPLIDMNFLWDFTRNCCKASLTRAPDEIWFQASNYKQIGIVGVSRFLWTDAFQKSSYLAAARAGLQGFVWSTSQHLMPITCLWDTCCWLFRFHELHFPRVKAFVKWKMRNTHVSLYLLADLLFSCRWSWASILCAPSWYSLAHLW